jgi:segregation and condensation protein A
LFLIKRSEINIYDIPIAIITRQYLEFLEYASKVDLENITDFYLMATNLLYIKSRMLLPVELDFDEDEGDPRRELVEQLIEYQKFKKLSELMTEQEEQAEWQLERVRKQRSLPFEDDDGLWDQIDVWDLLKSFSLLMQNLTPERIIDLYEEVSVNEKISLIHELLDERSEFTFSHLLRKSASVMDVVCAFLAVLESVKARTIAIFQNRMFGDIRIRRGPGSQAGDAVNPEVSR